jgi:hypothetical protein
MTLDFVSKTYPAGDITDGQYLYRSLGSFWTQIFQDKNALKGYTRGMAEEATQAYRRLVEVIQQYSVKDIPILHKEKWKPLYIKKSDFNKTPLLFKPDDAVFGFQPESDRFYANQLFRFGYPKESNRKTVFSYTPGFSLKKFSTISNRIISPSLLLIHGVDVIIKDSTLFFNTDLFENEYIPKSKLISDAGEPVTFKDTEGNTLEDELIVLWLYNAEIDEQSLYNNFGVLYDLYMPSSDSYKNILKAIINLSVEGPTINALSIAFASIAGLPVVIEPVERIEDVYSDDLYNYVVTDKNTYKVTRKKPLSPSVIKGRVFYAGEILASGVRVLDSLISPSWWRNDLPTSKLAFASNVFAAHISNQLFFENEFRQITYKQTPRSLVQWRADATSPWIDLSPLYKLEGASLTDSREIELRCTSEYVQWRYSNAAVWNNITSLVSLEAASPVELRVTRRITFPVIGRDEDVQAFEDYINTPSNQKTLVNSLNFAEGFSGTTTINPVDFVFSNFFKNNSLLLKLEFISELELNKFFDLYSLFKDYLPPHVYVVVQLNFSVSEEVLSNLNGCLSFPEFEGRVFSMDGSVPRTGARPEIIGGDANYYKNLEGRLFCVAIGPYRNPAPEDPDSVPQPLHYNPDPVALSDPDAPTNLDTLLFNNSEEKDNAPGIKCGLMRTEIPLQVILPGETVPRQPSTKEIPSILLIDF